MSNQLKDEPSMFFPYESVRHEQGNAINQIYDELNNKGKHVVVSAPNGYGKTILSLASILPIIKNKGKKLIYLCRTHTQIQRVIDELVKINSEMKKNGLNIEIGGLGLRGRNAMCFHQVVLELTDPNLAHITCTDLKKNNRCLYFNNISRKTERVDFLLSILQISPMDGSQLIEICKDYDLCPYYICKLALNRVDVIACNYQWVINPFIRSGLLDNLDTKLEDIILVIDEAHNIPDIATEISSLRLTKTMVESFLKEIYDYNRSHYSRFGKILLEIFEDLMKNKMEEFEIIPALIVKKINSGFEINEKFFKDMIESGVDIRNQKMKDKKPPHSYIFTMGNFWLRWLETMDKDSFFFLATRYMTKKRFENLKLEIVSLDPRDTIRDLFENIEGSLHMSGTITPEAYVDIVGLPENTVKLNLPSLWKKDNLKALVIKEITSKGNFRSPDMYKQMIELINVAIEHTPKNIGVFAASYDILNGLIDAGIEKIKTKKKIFVEKSGTSSEQNDSMIRDYKEASNNEGGVLLGVCGGRNAEGEDFPGDFMNTVIVCGIPFARPSAKVQSLINYYLKHWGKEKGRDLSYNIPALRRANQAAGRPIRTLEDRGVIILMDYRYSMSYFNKFLAGWLRDRIKVIENDPEKLKKELQSFYRAK